MHNTNSNLHDSLSTLRGLRSLGSASEKLALRAVLHAQNLLGLATGNHLREARFHKDPLRLLQARLEESEMKARLAWKAFSVLQARFAKIPDGRRPYFTPTQRFEILEMRNLMGWTREQAASLFLVCPNTISNWELAVNPETKTVGSTVRPVPPVVRFQDSVRRLVQSMKAMHFGSDNVIAMTVVRAGWKIAKRSVSRIVREKLLPLSPAETPAGPKPTRPVKADFVHHVWMMDVSEVKAFLGGPFYMATVFDAFSRVPLVFQTFEKKPDSRAMATLLKFAARGFAKPKYVITDLGSEFKGAFKKILARRGIVQRLRTKGHLGATARLESFWRTLKNTASLRFPIFLTLEDLERRLAPALLHYVCFRPHQGLHGMTPAELFLGIEPASASARRAPRGRAGEGDPAVPFRIETLSPDEKRFPILVPVSE